MSYTLVYFRGCPNAEIAMDLLREVGIEFTAVCQDELPETHALRAFTSPTLLEREEIVFGSRHGGSQACSLGVPSERELLERLYGRDPEKLP